MGSSIVRQPDGKFAAFSTVPEDFFAWGMTEAEAYELCRENMDLGREASRRMVLAGVEDHVFFTNVIKGDGQSRWRAAVAMMALNKTRAMVVERLVEMGFGDYGLEDVPFPSEDEAHP